MIIQIKKYRQELFMLLSFPLALFFNAAYSMLVNAIRGGFFVFPFAYFGYHMPCKANETLDTFRFPYLFMTWEIGVPLIIIYLLRKKVDSTFLIGFFYIPEFIYVALKLLNFSILTNLDIRYTTWMSYTMVVDDRFVPNYWLFLLHFILIYITQYLIFRKYEQPNLVKNFALGVLSYFGFFFAYSVFYYVLRFF